MLYQKNDFQWSKLKKMGVALFEFYLYQLRYLSSFRAPNLPLKCSFFSNFAQKIDFEWLQFQRDYSCGTDWILFTWVFFIADLEVVLKLQTFRWMNIFIIKMFIFANFVQKDKFKWLVSENGRVTEWMLFGWVVFIAGINGKLLF